MYSRKRKPNLIKLEQMNNKYGLLELDSGYQIYPSQSYIFDHHFIIDHLLIQYQGTSVEWKGLVNLSTLQQPLKHTIHLKSASIEVYLNDIGKPNIGSQLNKRCIATFTSNKAINQKAIEKKCKKYNTQLLMIDYCQNKFQVEIPHFTKYNFDESDDEEQIEQIKTNRSNVDNNFVKEILNDRILSLNSKKLFDDPLQVKFKFYPSGALLNEVNQHNKTKNQYHNKYSYQTNFNSDIYSVNILKSQSSIYLQLPNVKQQPIFMLQTFFSFITQPDQLIQHNLNHQLLSNKFKRIFWLLRICFYHEQTKIKWNKSTQQFIQNRSTTVKQQQNDIKNWIEYAVNNSQIQRCSDQIYQYLSTRNLNPLINKSIQDKKLSVAQFLACIEDRFYRDDTSQIDLLPQLDQIKLQKLQCLPQMNWMKQLGCTMWYFLRTRFTVKLSQVLEKHKKNVNSFEDQFRILQIYLGKINSKESKMGLVFSKNVNSLMDYLYTWYISYRLNQQQQKHFKSKISYSKYRYRIVRQILFRLESVEKMVTILNMQNYLTNQLKQTLLLEVLNKKPSLVQPFLLQAYPNQHNIAYQVKTIHQISKFHYFEALTNFIQIRNPSDTLKMIVIRIMYLPQLYLSFKKSVLMEHMMLSERLKLPQLQKVKTVVSIRLQSKYLNIYSLSLIVSLAQSLSNNQRSILMNIIYPILTSSSIIRLLRTQNKQLLDRLLALYSDNKKAQKYLTIMSVSS